MKIYQVYKWDNHLGPSCTFHSNKADAIKTAKYWAKQGTMDGEITVSVLNIPLKKSGIINALNGIGGTAPYYKRTRIESYASVVSDE